MLPFVWGHVDVKLWFLNQMEEQVIQKVFRVGESWEERNRRTKMNAKSVSINKLGNFSCVVVSRQSSASLRGPTVWNSNMGFCRGGVSHKGGLLSMNSIWFG